MQHHPPATVTARSTAQLRRLAEFPQVLQHRRQVVHRGERVAVLGAQLPLFGLQDSVQQRLRLGSRAPPARPPASAVDRHGSRKVATAPWGREGTFFTICGVVAYFWIQVPGEKTRFRVSNCFDFT